MNLQIIVDLEDRKYLKFYDNSPKGQDLPTEIYSYTLEVYGSIIPGGQLPYSLDIIQYLKSSMKQDEIYTLGSGDLGFQDNVDIPDGIYHFDYTMNTIYTVRNSILVYQGVKARVDELLKLADYSIEVLSNKMKYLSDKANTDYAIEKVRYAKTLMDKLEEYASLNDEVEVLDTLDKLNRLLGILNIK